MSKPIQADLRNKITVVTGANTGMGLETARALARMNATVILACRSPEKGQAAKEDIISSTGNRDVEVMALDLSSQQSIRAFARALVQRHPAIHVLVNNAGMWTQEKQLGADGVELQWATNVVGPHLLTAELKDALVRGKARVVNVASSAAGGLDLKDPEFNARPYNGLTAYTASKQANRMLSWAWAEKLRGTGVTVNAANPGLVATELNRGIHGAFKLFFALTRPFAKGAADGADTAIWLAAAPELDGKTGGFYEKRREIACKFRNTEERALFDLVEKTASPARGTASAAAAVM